MHKFAESRRPLWIASSIAAVAVLLIPAAYLAGWLGDLGQVQPVLSSLQKAHQAIAWQESRQPQEPPAKSPQVAVQLTDSAVTLSWSSIPSASSYDIYRATRGVSFGQATSIAEVSQHTTTISYTDTSVRPGKEYTYWVAASNTAGEGPISTPSSVHVYDTWGAITKEALSATAIATATASQSTAWGILGTSSTSTKVPVFDIAHTLMSPYKFSSQSQRSSFLTQRTTSWHLGQASLTAAFRHGISVLSGSDAALSSLAIGSSTPSEMVVFASSGHLMTAIVASGTSPLPSDALVLNQFGQAVGISNQSGTLLPIRG